jgi:arsenate reductase
MILYGIPNCNTVKKARTWLEENNIPYTFHDYKKAGITEAKLREWLTQTDWQTLVNKQGTTWRQLDKSVQEKTTTEKAAIQLMLEKNSVMKRPIAETAKGIVVGFDEAKFKALEKGK